MTRSTWNKAFAVGLLVAVCGVAFLVAFTFFRKGGYSEKDTYVVYAYFEDATGLTWKSRVQIAGIQVGEVERIVLDEGRARLDLRIKKDIEIRADACVTKRFPSTLLPDALLDLAPGTARAASLRALPPEQRQVSCVMEGTSIAKLLDSLSKIATDVQAITGELQSVVAGSQGSIRQIIANLEQASARLDASLAQGGGKIQAILDNAQSFTGTLAEVAAADKGRYRAIARNVEEASVRLNTVLAGVQQLLGTDADPGAAPPAGGAGQPTPGRRPGGAGVKGGSRSRSSAEGAQGEVAIADWAGTSEAPPAGPPGAAPGGAPGVGPGVGPGIAPGVAPAPTVREAADLRSSVAKLNRSLDELQRIAEKIGEGKGVAGKLLADERLGNKVGGALEQVSDYVDRLSRLQLQVHLRSEWYWNQTGAKTYAGLKLLPRPDKYYIFEIVSDPRGVNTTTAITQSTETPTGTVDTRTTQTVNQAQGLAFTLEFAKRYGPLALRIGLIESSGGAGADLFLLDERLKISAEIYQFSRTVSNVVLPPGVRALPRAKLWADYTFLKYFYLTVGSDDFLNRWRANRFPAGAQFNIGSDIFFGAGLVFTDDDLKTLLGVGGGAIAGGAATAGR